MLKKTITYPDYNGGTLTQDFYFNLSQAEIMEMEMSTTGGLVETINRIVAAQDTASIVKIFKDLILKAYGVKSLDGQAFLKEDEDGRPLYNKFKQTEAYSQLFMELATNADKAAEFVNGIVPQDVAKAAAEQIGQQGLAPLA